MATPVHAVDWTRRLALVQAGLKRLRQARVSLVDAGCPQAAAAVRRALKSAEGAERHAYARLQADDAEVTAVRAGNRLIRRGSRVSGRYRATCTHNTMVPHDEPGFAWRCVCGYVYGKPETP